MSQLTLRNSFGQMLQRSNLRRLRVLPIALSAVLATSPTLADEHFLPGAQDLRYGEALYEYHQGNFFNALTGLQVAQFKGGIKGHGDHPLLVEGGLMLAFGMTRAAKAHFESVLDQSSEARVSSSVRNQAWFYLGKVFYLEADYEAAEQAFSRLDLGLLETDAADLAQEARYLNSQVALALGKPAQAYSETDNLWSIYAQYNQILKSLSQGEADASVTSALDILLEKLKLLPSVSSEEAERESLEDRLNLSLGQLYLQYQQYTKAAEHLQKVKLDSALADEALFQYAVASSHLEQYEKALGALQTLESRPLFTPWLQQVPYALAYLYERLGDIPLALQAYAAAADQYDQQLAEIATQQEQLSEASLLESIEQPFSDRSEPTISDNKSSETSSAYVSGSRTLTLGDLDAQNDAYGRLNVRPAKFELAQLLASEAFQLALRDLHELYKLRDSLKQWDQQLDTFELMLATRAEQRRDKLITVTRELSQLDADEWQSATDRYEVAINTALENEDEAFFMNADQMEFVEMFSAVKENLALMPNGEDTEEFRIKLARAESYFEWWLADTFGVNRWAAQKQLKGLKASMEEFQSRNRYLKSELVNTSFQADLERRVDTGRQQVLELAEQIEVALEQVRERMVALVEVELGRQKLEVERYRLAARHAQARLSDLLYRQAETAEVAPVQQQDSERTSTDETVPKAGLTEAEPAAVASEEGEK